MTTFAAFIFFTDSNKNVHFKLLHSDILLIYWDTCLFYTGSIYMRLDSHRDGRHAFPITRSWAEVTNGVDAAFSFSDKMYMIKVGLRFFTQKTFSLTPNKIPAHPFKKKPNRMIKCTSTRQALTTPSLKGTQKP